MLTLLAAGAGLAGAIALARAAARSPARSRARAVRTRSGRTLPARVRGPLARALRDAELDVSPEDAVIGAVVTVGVAALVASSLAVAVVPIAVAGAAAAGPVALVLARGRAQRRFVESLPAFADLVAARLRSGHTVPSALSDAAESRGPVAADIRRVLRRVDHGEPLDAALTWWAGERAVDPVRALAGAFAVAAATGGAAADALEGLARSLRDHLGARAEAVSLSAQARLSALVVGLAPVVYLVFASSVDPGATTALIGSSVGRVCLVSGLALDGLGAWWMRRIVRSEP